MERLHLINSIIIWAMLMVNMGCISNKETNKNRDMAASKAIVAKQFEQWKNGEVNFFDLLADDATWTVSGRSPVSGTYKGKKDFMERSVRPITEKFKAPLKPELVSLTADDTFVWLHFIARTTTRADETYENTYVWKLQLREGKITSGIAFLDTYELALLMNARETTMDKKTEETKAYIGMWVTADGHIRHELLPGNRYNEARGNRKSAYQGSYKVSGNHIDYKDDTGFTADGEFKDGILYHAGMVLYKEKK